MFRVLLFVFSYRKSHRVLNQSLGDEEEREGDSPRTPPPRTLGMRCRLIRPRRSPSCWDRAAAGASRDIGRSRPAAGSSQEVRSPCSGRARRRCRGQEPSRCRVSAQDSAPTAPAFPPPRPSSKLRGRDGRRPGARPALSLFCLPEAASQSPAPPAGARALRRLRRARPR